MCGSGFPDIERHLLSFIDFAIILGCLHRLSSSRYRHCTPFAPVCRLHTYIVLSHLRISSSHYDLILISHTICPCSSTLHVHHSQSLAHVRFMLLIHTGTVVSFCHTLSCRPLFCNSENVLCYQIHNTCYLMSTVLLKVVHIMGCPETSKM